MLMWLPDLKQLAVCFNLGAIFFATRGFISLYKGRQLSYETGEENVSQQKLRTFQFNGLAGLVISLLFLTLSCWIEILSSASVASILALISLTIIGTALMTGLLMLAEKSKLRYKE